MLLVFAAGLLTAFAVSSLVFGRRFRARARRLLRARKTAILVKSLLESLGAEKAGSGEHLAGIEEALKEVRGALSELEALEGGKLGEADEAEIEARVSSAKEKARKAREEAKAREEERAGIRAVLDAGLGGERKARHLPLNANSGEKLEGRAGDERYRPRDGVELKVPPSLEASVEVERLRQQRLAQNAAGKVARKTGPLNALPKISAAAGAKPKADWDDVARQFSAGMDKVLSESGLNGKRLNDIAKKVSSPFFRAQIPAEQWISWGLRARKKGAYEAAALLFDKATVSGRDLQRVRQALYLSGELRISKGIDPVKGVNRIRKLLELGGDDAWTEAAKKMVITVGGR